MAAAPGSGSTAELSHAYVSLRIELKAGTYSVHDEKTTRTQYEVDVAYNKLVAHKPEVSNG